MRQAREFLYFLVLPWEASMRFPFFDRGTSFKATRLGRLRWLGSGSLSRSVSPPAIQYLGRSQYLGLRPTWAAGGLEM